MARTILVLPGPSQRAKMRAAIYKSVNLPLADADCAGA